MLDSVLFGKLYVFLGQMIAKIAGKILLSVHLIRERQIFWDESTPLALKPSTREAFIFDASSSFCESDEKNFELYFFLCFFTYYVTSTDNFLEKRQSLKNRLNINAHGT